jgi:hypothetical protein
VGFTRFCGAGAVYSFMPVSEQIALHFNLNRKTVYCHVMKLIVKRRLHHKRGKLAVENERIEPSVCWFSTASISELDDNP